MDSFVGLQMLNDLKQVVRPRVSLRAQHPHETFGRYVGSLGQSAQNQPPC